MEWSLPKSPALQAALAVTSTLHRAGFAAFFAGGSVRDLLLGHPPKDFDVATSALPDQTLALFRGSGFKTFELGAHFGVILVVVPVSSGSETHPISIEVATFRNDGAYLDGRRPDAVRFSQDAREDVLRRDFTINGMLLDPALLETDANLGFRVPEAALRDFVGGRADLEHRLLRTIGSASQRFQEDKLRMLRAVRFAARLGFELEPATFAAISRYAAEIGQVSAERIRDELTRMLTEGRARQAFELLSATGLLAQVLPEVARMHGVAQPPEYHPEGDVWVHTLLLLEKLPTGAPAELAWGFLLHDVGKPATFQPPNPAKPGDRIRFNGHAEAGVRIAEVMLNRLRFSNDEKAQILSLIQHHMQFGDIRAMKQSTLKRFIRMPHFDQHLALHRADCLSAHGDLRLWEFAKDAYEHDEPEPSRAPLLVTGRDLIASGYKPSPRFKAMLEATEDAQLEGRITTREEGLALVREAFGPSDAAV